MNAASGCKSTATVAVFLDTSPAQLDLEEHDLDPDSGAIGFHARHRKNSQKSPQIASVAPKSIHELGTTGVWP